jgi:ubiquinone/menaquinone biosynthesis C-methylase UbiE
MNASSAASTLPPVYNRIEKHAIFPEVSHDEHARYNFLANLNKHISSVILPGNKVAFEKRVKPQFVSRMGRDFNSRDEVKTAICADPQYQTWSALRRSTMEMRQQAGRSLVLRQIESLAEKARTYNAQRPDTLRLDPSVQVPHYLAVMDNHCMPGSYHTEYIEGDVANAANYDGGLFVTTAGGLGKLTDGGGKAVVAWLKTHYPSFSPKRILDIGCGLGHNTLPLAIGYPEGQVTGIDVGAPMLRYGHARSVALGVHNVAFEQVNAERLPYPDASQDWVQTTMFLHETSMLAMQHIIQEIYRVLKPGGLMLHIEQPQYTPDMPLYEQFMRDWDAFHNNEPFWGAMHEVDMKSWMLSAGFGADNLLQFGAKAVNDYDDFTKPKPTEQEDYGRAAAWNVFGAWKK